MTKTWNVTLNPQQCNEVLNCIRVYSYALYGCKDSSVRSVEDKVTKALYSGIYSLELSTLAFEFLYDHIDSYGCNSVLDKEIKATLERVYEDWVKTLPDIRPHLW
jgi:hypothetical protein